MPENNVNTHPSLDSLVGEVADEFLRRQEQGEQPRIEEYTARHPEGAEVLRKVLASLQLLEISDPANLNFTEHAPSDTLAKTLGDYRIQREVGRGGMGVVYEAEQISLGRRVALKVLPFAVTMDPRHLQRFNNEARAAASLDHPHIVKVHAVGQERGVHYYAMQFIDGQTLAQFIDQQKGTGSQAKEQPEPAAKLPATADQTQPYQPKNEETPETPEKLAKENNAAAVGTPSKSTVVAKHSTQKSSIKDKAYFQNVARLGIQAAEALEHAHSLGIVHRDIKPGNLMLDERGELWVTDFGLARTAADAGLTMTGDVLGTLRYMSPEQALAKHGLVDHRTDIYALGVTLYELLTFQCAIGVKDRQEILIKIASEEPTAPHKLNRAIPGDLETILLKAMSKEPQARYKSAQELAEDLRRFLNNKPIQAKKPGLVQKVRKLAQRNRTAVWAGGLALLVAIVALGVSVGWVVGEKSSRQTYTESVVADILADIEKMHKKKDWFRARELALRAQALMETNGSKEELQRKVADLLWDYDMVIDLDDIRLEIAQVKKDHFDLVGGTKAYQSRFQKYQIDLLKLRPEEAARLIRSRSISAELVESLDELAFIYKRKFNDPTWKRMVKIARLVHPNDWANKVRDALAQDDLMALEVLASSDRAIHLSPATLNWVCVTLGKQNSNKRKALNLWRKAQQRYPNNLWINHYLAYYLANSDPPELEEAIRFYQAALALQPNSPGIYLNLGVAFLEKNRTEEAIAAFDTAIALKPDFAHAYNNLGNALGDNHQMDEAIAALQKAIALKPIFPEAHFNLGVTLKDNGQVDEAIAAFEKAIALKPDLAEAHFFLGQILGKKEQWEKAIVTYQKFITLEPNSAKAHYSLGIALKNSGQLDRAIVAYQKAIQLNPNFAEAHCNLGGIYKDRGQFLEALKFYRLGHELGSRHPKWAYPSAQWVQQCQQLVQMDRQLHDVLKNSSPPAKPAELIHFAFFCQNHKRRYVDSATLYQKAFAAQPTLATLSKGVRYNAACAAILAGLGQGEDAGQLSDGEKAEWRRQAMSWLQADLDKWDQQVKGGDFLQVFNTIKEMQHWKKDKDLAGVRDSLPLAKLPGPEQKEWQTLWSKVEQVLQESKESAGSCDERTIPGVLTAKIREQTHSVPMAAGKIYIVDLQSKYFDPLLRLHNLDGKVLLEDDDSGGDLNARIVFTPNKTGTYQLTATCFGQKGLGSYTLIIREFHQKKEMKNAQTTD